MGRLLFYLVGDLDVDGVYRFFEDLGESSYSLIPFEDIIEIEYDSFANLIHPEIVPLAPGPIIPQLLLLSLAILPLEFLKIFKELQLHRPDIFGMLKLRRL